MRPASTYRFVSAAIRTHRDVLATSIVDRQYGMDPQRWEAFGAEGRQKSLRDVRYHLDYLTEALEAEDQSLFVNYVDWARTLYSSLGLGEDALETSLRIMLDILPQALSTDLSDLALDFINRGLRRLQTAGRVPPTHLIPDAPNAQLAQTYLESLLSGSRRQATAIILQAVELGTSVKDIYLHVFQPVQRELGRLWQLGEISVAQEHLATAVTQFIMSQLYPRIFATERCGRRLVAACVGDELHELGIRMVADFFEMGGWDTYYFGASTPSTAIVSATSEYEPHVLALSVTMTFHVRTLAELIEQLRAREHGARTPVLVGGYPFNTSPGLWRRIGADAVAHDAEEAIPAANRLLKDPEP